MQFVDLKMLAKQTSLSVPTLRKYLRQGMPHLRLEHKILVDPKKHASGWRPASRWWPGTAGSTPSMSLPRRFWPTEGRLIPTPSSATVAAAIHAARVVRGKEA